MVRKIALSHHRENRQLGPDCRSTHLLDYLVLMSWIAIIWSMSAAVCLTLAGIFWLVWRRNHSAWANLLFCLTAVSTAAFAFCELRMMRAEHASRIRDYAEVGASACVAVVCVARRVRAFVPESRAILGSLGWSADCARWLSFSISWSGRISTTARSPIFGTSGFSANPSRSPRVCPIPGWWSAN